MPSKYTTRDTGFGYFLEWDLKRKTESLRITHYKQKEESLLLPHFHSHTSSRHSCTADFEISACWAFSQVITYIFKSPLLHLEQLRCPRSHISAPHSSSFLLETLLSEVCVIHPIFLFFFTLRSLETWHKNCLKFRIIAVFPFLTDWHFFNGSKFYYFHAFYYKLHSMIFSKISHHLSF